MIEAVNSAVANASLVRGVTEQAASARLTAISSAPTAEAGGERQIILAPYVSPFVYVDNQFNKAVLQIRDSDTGEVQRQFPSEQTLQARAASEAAVRDEAILDKELSRGSSATTSSPAQATVQSSTLFAASQLGASVSAPRSAPVASAPAPVARAPANVARAQIASAALSASSLPPSGGTVNTSA